MKAVLFLMSLLTIAARPFAQLKPVESGVIHWTDLRVKKDTGRESRQLTEGTTTEFEYFEIHATTQLKGAVAKPPHTQQDQEELIIIKEGTMRCTIGNKTAILGPSGVLLIPPLQSQSFENIGDSVLTYYVFKFRSKKPMNIERSTQAGGALLLNADSLVFKKSEKGGGRKYFDRPTAMCENMEIHVTSLAHKGPSHAPHTHIETELTLITEGNTEMTIDGKTYTAGPGDLYIANSGSLHAISNATDKPCSYFAIKWK